MLSFVFQSPISRVKIKGHIWRLDLLGKFIQVSITFQFRFGGFYVFDKFVAHFRVLQVRVRVIDVHDVFVKQSLSVLYLLQCQVTFTDFLKHLRVTFPDFILSVLALKYGLANVNPVFDISSVTKCWFFDIEFDCFDYFILFGSIERNFRFVDENRIKSIFSLAGLDGLYLLVLLLVLTRLACFFPGHV